MTLDDIARGIINNPEYGIGIILFVIGCAAILAFYLATRKSSRQEKRT